MPAASRACEAEADTRGARHERARNFLSRTRWLSSTRRRRCRQSAVRGATRRGARVLTDSIARRNPYSVLRAAERLIKLGGRAASKMWRGYLSAR